MAWNMLLYIPERGEHKMRLTKEKISKALQNYIPFNCMPDKDDLVNILYALEVHEVILLETDTVQIKTFQVFRLDEALHIINSLQASDIIYKTRRRYNVWWD